MTTRFYVCGIGYDDNGYVTDYDQYFGDFDTYEEAYELFVKVQCKDYKSFFENAPKINHLIIQLEECEETEDAIICVDIRNEFLVENPNL